MDEAPLDLPPGLPFLRLRLVYRLERDAGLPPAKGVLLRGGLGLALRAIGCRGDCADAATCPASSPCPYRRLFEPGRPPGLTDLHDLRDPPRPFVLLPPDDPRTRWQAGEEITFGLTLIGRATAEWPVVISALAALGDAGLGAGRVPARLVRAKAVGPGSHAGVAADPWQARALNAAVEALHDDAATIVARADALPADLRLRLVTPLRLTAAGRPLATFDLPRLVEAAAWRLRALALFHGEQPWVVSDERYMSLARSVAVQPMSMRWVAIERTSTRPERGRMVLGGLVGEARLQQVPAALRRLLVATELSHVGKASVFGHGAITLTPDL